MKRFVSAFGFTIVAVFALVSISFGQSLFIPGGANYVRCGDLDVPGNQITVEALVTQMGPAINIVSKHQGPGDVNYLLRPNQAEITTTNGYVNSPSGLVLNIGQCYHVAFTYDGANLKFYVNGCLASSTPHTGNLIQNNFITAIGNISMNGSESWNGYIDEVRIWNVARTQVQIQSNMYNLPTPTIQPGLLAYFTFNGNYLNAQGNPAFNGTLTGAPSLQNNAACTNVDLSFQNSLVTTDVSCFGDTDGTATITSTGGHPNYQYSVDGVNYFPLNSVNNLPPGNATIWASSGIGNGCIEQIPLVIGEPLPIATSVTGTDPSCTGGNDGTADLTVNEGTPPYTFSWSTGSTLEDPIDLVAGNNTVAVTDDNGCTATENIILTDPAPIQTSFTGTDPSCPGTADGTADLTVNGGNPPYTYLWSSGSTAQDPNDLVGGNNTVTITDGGGCTATETIVLTDPTAITTSVVGTDPSCTGDTDGAADLTVNGGTPPYTYSWSSGGTIQDPNNLAAGNHTVTITDNAGCTATESVLLTDPTALQAAGVGTDPSCNGGSDGSIDLTVNGGTAGYTFSWSSGGVAEDPTGRSAGSHTVTVTDANGCTTTATVVLGEPTALQANAVGTNPGCNGGNDGSANLTVSGGTPAYTYAWSNGSTQEDPNNLAAGNNTVVVTDANGCVANANVVLTDPPVIQTAITGVDPSCNGGSNGTADLTVNGGTPPFSFLWSSGSTQEDPTNLVAGTNTVQITDANGCVANESIDLTEPTAVLPNAYSNYVSGAGMCDGGGVANPSGGVPPYTYSWSNGQTTQVATGMCEGPHTVTVTDASGCVGTQIITVNVPACLTDVDFYTWQQAGQPANGNWVVENAGAQVRQTVNGNPTFFVTPVDYINVRMRGKMRTTNSDDDMMGVVFGFKDPLGASDNFDMWLFDWKQGPQTSGAGTVASEGFALSHAVGTIPVVGYDLTFWGHTNTPEFTVVATNYGNNGWNQNVDYEVEVTYTVNRAVILVDGDTIFDIYDCFEPGRFGFYNYSQQQVIYSDFTYELFADFSVDDAEICAGDTAHFTFLEQCGNFNNFDQFDELQWNYGDGTTETVSNISLQTVNPTHVYQTGGNYTIQLIALDTLGCRDTVYQDILVHPNPTADFTFADQCFQDVTQFTDATVQGDHPLSGWNWEFGDNATATTQNASHQYGSPNTYTVRLAVEDTYGCVDTSEQTVDIYVLPQADFAPIDDCFSTNYPFQDLSTVSNGTVTGWEWDFGDGGTAATQNPTHSYAGFGQYDVELVALSDQGCGDTLTQTIVLHDNPVAGFILPELCQMQPALFSDTASIQEGTITGWSWDFGNGNSSIQQNPTHMYTDAGPVSIVQTVTSNFGCSNSINVPAIVDPKPLADFSTQNVCLNENMLFQDQSSIASGNVVLWEWDFGDTNTDAVQNTSNLYTTFGNYTVELMVESDQGCRDTTQQAVEVYQLPVADFSFADVCLIAEATFNDQSSSNSGAIDTWLWDLGDATTFNGQGQVQHNYAAATDYDVELIVETDLGCRDTLLQTITIHPMPQAEFTADSVCFQLPTNFTNESNISTGTINNYAWDFGYGGTSADQNPTFVFPQTGYSPVFLTITSDFGCKDTITKPIRVYVLPQPEFTHNDTCFEDDVHFVSLSQISEGTIDQYDWDFGDANTSGLQDPVHHYGAEGFYQAGLTTTSNFGCDVTVTHTVEIFPLPQVAFDALPSAGCQPLTVTFDNLSDIADGYFISGYQWDFGHGLNASSTHPQTVYNDDGLYDVQLIATSTKGCDDTLLVTNAIDVWPRPEAGFHADKEEYIMFFPEVEFIDESIGATEWYYDFDDGAGSADQNPVHEYQEAGTYQVIQTVNNDFGCDDVYSQRVIVKPAITLYIPNAFTPNADGNNEVFAANGVGIEEYEMWIFDRWGENIFYSSKMDYGWDGTYKGKQVESGTYVYRFVVMDVNKETHQYTGEVYLVR